MLHNWDKGKFSHKLLWASSTNVCIHSEGTGCNRKTQWVARRMLEQMRF